MASGTAGYSGIAERYATALYDLGSEAKALDRTAKDLADLKSMIAGSADLLRLLRSPLMSRENQWKAMESVLRSAEAGDLTRRFIGVIADNRRLFALEAIIDRFLRLLAERRGELTAEVTTATKLDDEQQAALADALKKELGAKVAIELNVEPAILGGLIVRVGSRMFDSSLQTKLQRMQLAMKGIG